MTATTSSDWTAGRIVKAYGTAFLAFLVIDYGWLTQVGPRLYGSYIPHLMADQADLLAAALFYLLYIAGIVILAVMPSLSLRTAAARGGFLGLVCYGTFDLTSQAAFKDWSWIVTGADLMWGTVLTGTITTITWWLVAAPLYRQDPDLTA